MDIKKIRLQTGLSQSKFAGMFEIPVATLKDWEQGRRTPPSYVVNMIQMILQYKGLLVDTEYIDSCEKRRESVEQVFAIHMEAYTGFAEVYDTFMDNVPYTEWADYLQDILKEHGINDGLVLELGCGTGSMSEELALRGYDMIGVDNSEEMLEIAARKKEKSGQDILYLLQDMQAFELYGTVRAIVSVCDSLNYITDEEELLEVFRLANNYLDPEGVFLFDFNTRYKYETVLGNRTIAEDRDESSFIWDNYYYEDEKINEYELTLFIRENEERDLYRKYQETHYQRAYTLEEIKKLLAEAGLVFEAAYDAYTKEPVKETSERICVAAREHGKSV